MNVHQDKKNVEMENDLADLVRVIFRKKWLILGIVMALTCSSIIASLLIPNKYRSEGFLILSESSSSENAINQNISLSIPEYKRYSNLFLRTDLFINYLLERKPLPEKKLKKIISDFKNKKGLDGYINPSYAYSKADLKDIAQINKDVHNFIIGTTIRFMDTDPKAAQVISNYLGDFLELCMVKDKLHKFVDGEISSLKIEMNVVENTLLNNSFQMEQLLLKKKRLEEIQKKYSELKNLNTRQVISVDKEGKKFLSPVIQLIGIESTISELKSSIDEKKRKGDIIKYKMAYFARSEKHLKEISKEKELLKYLTDLVYQIFPEEKLDIDNIKIARNDILNTLENYSKYFHTILKFGPEPNLPVKKTGPRRTMIVAGSFVFSIIFSLFFVLIFEWWGMNKEKILK